MLRRRIELSLHNSPRPRVGQVHVQSMIRPGARVANALAVARNFPIVTLCGSAGALPAYVQILRSMPQNSGMGFVILTHRRAGRACDLVNILSAVTNMQVEEIGDGSALLANRVHVIPAGKDLTTDGTVFRLAPMSTVFGWPDGFDIFLRSLAQSTHRRAVTIILSGMSADGSAALGTLRRQGCVAFAQTDATMNSMPKHAVATGNVDYFCSAADIGKLVSALPVSNFTTIEIENS
jgi:two-component system CheB/CheR fusion protein